MGDTSPNQHVMPKKEPYILQNGLLDPLGLCFAGGLG